MICAKRIADWASCESVQLLVTTENHPVVKDALQDGNNDEDMMTAQ